MRTVGALTVVIGFVVAAWWAVVRTVDDPYDRVTVGQVAALDGALVDRPAQAFTLLDLDGREHALESLRGEVVFLNFWATWCPPCVEEMPAMRQLSLGLRGRPFRMVAVTQDSDIEVLRAFLVDAGFTGDDALILLDPDGVIARRYGTRLLPETYLLDQEGRVVARFMGPRDWDSDAAYQLIERIIRFRWRAG